MKDSVKIAWHKSRLRSAYLKWRSIGSDLDCGLSLARVIRPTPFVQTETAMHKHAEALRALGESVPVMPGESQ